MKILCLYNNEIALELFEWIEEQGHEVVLFSDKLIADWCEKENFDLTVSYTYRYILSYEVLKALHFNAVNIHNAYLPYNRGADPNLWSILEDTPRGVTLHHMSEELDKGDIVAQSLAPKVKDDETLENTYLALDKHAKELFKKAFAYYDYWNDMRKAMYFDGTFHRVSDGQIIKNKINQRGGYNISITSLKKLWMEIH